MIREYAAIAERITPTGSRAERIRAVVDALWEGLCERGVSWAGVYDYEDAPELVLTYGRNKPACSPIGLHGACGRAWTDKRPLIVRDVRALGENYVACDPRDLSEVIIPLIEPDESCSGVLDLDSFEVAAFDQADVDGLALVLQAASLTAGTHPPAETLRL